MYNIIENDQSLKKCINITIPNEIIKINFIKKIKDISKKILINGFRKGKVPISVIKNKYSNFIYQETLNEIMHNNFAKIISKENINLIDKPIYSFKEYKINENFHYSVKFETYPNIDLINLESIKINKPIIEIFDKDINFVLKKINEQNNFWKEIHCIKKNKNRVTIDFSVYSEDKIFNKIKIKNFIFILNQNFLLSSFEKEFTGRKTGEIFNIIINYPTNYFLDYLSNKKLIFNIKLKKIEQIKNIKNNNKNLSIIKLINKKIQIKKSIKYYIKKITYNLIKTQLTKKIIKKTNILVPEYLIKKKIDKIKNLIIKNYKNKEKSILELLPYNISIEQIKFQIKLDLFLNKITNNYKIKIDENKFNNSMKEMLLIYNHHNKKTTNYSKHQLITKKLSNFLLEEQIIKVILKKVKYIEKKIKFTQIFNSRNLNIFNTENFLIDNIIFYL